METAYPHIKGADAVAAQPPHADVIALRTPRRASHVPVHAYAGDDSFSIYGDPEADDPTRPRLAWAAVFVWLAIAVLLIAGFAIGWVFDKMDSHAVLDFLSPTAAQARDAGWVAMSERF